MLDFGTSYKGLNERVAQDNVCHSHSAAVLAFPFKASKMADGAVSVAPAAPASEDDVIGRRMKAPLCSNEMTVVLDMIKYRAKQLGQAIWVTTGIFLTAMGVEELDDLRRCDFVRAVEHLVAFTASAQARKVMQ